jgi:hypothetical protein
MRTGRARFLALALSALLVAAAGSAWAITRDSGSLPITVPKLTTGELARGTTPSGGSWKLSGIDPVEFGDPYFAAHPTEWFCTALTTSAGPGTQGCSPIPDADGRFEGKPVRPSYSLLGTDRFFTIVAPRGVVAMDVRVAGEHTATRSRSIPAGAAGQLLLVAVGGPTVTSRDPASSREYAVRLLGPGGETVSEFAMSDPPLD